MNYRTFAITSCVVQQRNNLLSPSVVYFNRGTICLSPNFVYFNRGTISCRLLLCTSTEEQCPVALCCVFQQRNNLLSPYVVYRGTICLSPYVVYFNRGTTCLSPCVVYFNRGTTCCRLMLCISPEEQSAIALCCIFVNFNQENKEQTSFYAVCFTGGTTGLCHFLIIHQKEQSKAVILCNYDYHFSIRIVNFDEESDCHWFLLINKILRYFCHIETISCLPLIFVTTKTYGHQLLIPHPHPSPWNRRLQRIEVLI